MVDFNWLHLTDLHWGGLGSDDTHDLWPGVREKFYYDLDYILKQTGPLDLVLFTGDLAFSGESKQFDRVNEWLDELKSRLQERGDPAPQLLAVPGNHDLIRPPAHDAALLSLTKLWDHPTEGKMVQEYFWNDPSSDFRKVVEKAFSDYVKWWQKPSMPKPEVRDGLLPGNFAATIVKDGTRLGILGLNTAFLQLKGGDLQRKLALHIKQFHRPCARDGPAWATQHHACLLLTHHPPSWLTAAALEDLEGEIHSPAHRFALHLCGHMHEPEYRDEALGGADTRRRLQGCSLFAIEGWGEQTNGTRIHGYSVGRLRIHGNGGEPFTLSCVYLGLVDPFAKCLGGDVQISGYLRHRIPLIGGVNQPDGFFLEIGRVDPACLAHLLRPLSRNLIA